jgi:hypothetical protein
MPSKTEEAARAFANLNTWAAIEVLLEGGMLYGTRTHDAASKILKIARKERQKELKIYDRAKSSIDAA